MNSYIVLGHFCLLLMITVPNKKMIHLGYVVSS